MLSNDEIAIKDLVMLIKEIIGYRGNINFDKTKPDGNPRKLLNSSKIKKLGWEPKVKLFEGLKISYDWYLKNYI